MKYPCSVGYDPRPHGGDIDEIRCTRAERNFALKYNALVEQLQRLYSQQYDKVNELKLVGYDPANPPEWKPDFDPEEVRERDRIKWEYTARLEAVDRAREAVVDKKSQILRFLFSELRKAERIGRAKSKRDHERDQTGM